MVTTTQAEYDSASLPAPAFAEVASSGLERPLASAAGGFYASYGKRALDLLLGLPLLLAALPVILVAALAILVTSGRPVFYRARRVGRDGREFSMWKLRTMVPNADEVLEAWRRDNPGLASEYERTFKLQDDPRITPLGRFLRRTSLDELPQLFNVLRGDMSLVGPRPLVAEELQHYGRDAGVLLALRPGLTGAWQVDVRNALAYPARAWYELSYCRSYGAARDLSILLRTLVVPFRANGQ